MSTDSPWSRAKDWTREAENRNLRPGKNGITHSALTRSNASAGGSSAWTQPYGPCLTVVGSTTIMMSGLRRRIALAKQGLGRPQEALAELQQLAERKQAPFLHTDIAAAAWDAGDYASTFKHALHALVAPEDIGFKLDAARLMAQVLWQRGEAEHARNHLRLCLAVRESRGWKATADLTKLASSWDVRGQERDPDTILRVLRPLWERWTEELTPRLTGIITKMLANGYAGFIRGDDGTDFYFDGRDWKERRPEPAQGIRVTFATRRGFDRKRQRSTTVACEVRAASRHVNATKREYNAPRCQNQPGNSF
jgi:tetratricopeptide (TPR) repeat protein